MRRLLLAAISISVIAGLCAGVASARVGGSPARASKPNAPFHLPAALPAPDPLQPHAWGYRSSAAIARDIAAPGNAAHSAATSAASSSVTVTATVLPVVIIVLDSRGRVITLATNTPTRHARGVLFLVRHEDVDGTPGTLTAAVWAQARTALARAHAGTGTIWSR